VTKPIRLNHDASRIFRGMAHRWPLNPFFIATQYYVYSGNRTGGSFPSPLMGEDRVRVDDPGLVRETGMTIMVSSTSLAMPIASTRCQLPSRCQLPPHPSPLPRNARARDIVEFCTHTRSGRAVNRCVAHMFRKRDSAASMASAQLDGRLLDETRHEIPSPITMTSKVRSSLFFHALTSLISLQKERAVNEHREKVVSVVLATCASAVVV
jgi:hypothetical protein